MVNSRRWARHVASVRGEQEFIYGFGGDTKNKETARKTKI
jgi:hypothetical protein